MTKVKLVLRKSSSGLFWSQRSENGGKSQLKVKLVLLWLFPLLGSCQFALSHPIHCLLFRIKDQFGFKKQSMIIIDINLFDFLHHCLLQNWWKAVVSHHICRVIFLFKIILNPSNSFEFGEKFTTRFSHLPMYQDFQSEKSNQSIGSPILSRSNPLLPGPIQSNIKYSTFSQSHLVLVPRPTVSFKLSTEQRTPPERMLDFFFFRFCPILRPSSKYFSWWSPSFSSSALSSLATWSK